MGLDIHLYLYSDFEESQRKEKEYGQKSEEIWKTVASGKAYNDLTKEQRDEARVRCVEVINLWNQHLADTGMVKVAVVRPSMFPRKPEDVVHNETEALHVYREERDKHGKSKDSEMFGAYSNYRGEFHFNKEGLQVRALIPGQAKSFFKQGHQEQVTYAIYEADVSWYTTALEIVLETIDWVLDHPIPLGHRYVLHWSG